MTAATLTVSTHLFHSANETGVEGQPVSRWFAVSSLLYTILILLTWGSEGGSLPID